MDCHWVDENLGEAFPAFQPSLHETTEEKSKEGSEDKIKERKFSRGKV